MKRIILMGASILSSLLICAQSPDYDKKIKAMESVAAESARNEKIIDLTGKPNFVSEAKRLAAGGNFVDKNIKVDVPVSGVSLLGTNTLGDPSSSTATLEVMNFGTEGNTVLLTLNTTDGQKALLTISWSGKGVHVAPMLEQGAEGLVVFRGNKSLGGVAKAQGKWFYLLQESDGGMQEFYKGMTRAEVENVTNQLGLSKFKLSHKTDLYEVYSLYWIDMQKQYDIFGNYQYNMRNDKKYGDFYFNSAGKLIKWIIYM